MKKHIKLDNNTPAYQKITASVIILAAVVFGFYIFSNSHAASPYVSVNADSGTLTGSATVQNDPSTGDGRYVQFGTPATTSGATCTNPVYSSSSTEATWGASNGYLVNNDAWNGSAGLQTINVCDYDSWYVTSNQPNDGGAIETYPDTEDNLVSAPYSCTMPNCGPVISSMNTLTSTFGITVPSGTNIGYDAAYDTWINWGTKGYCEEVMVWNKYENDLNGYSFTYANQSIGGSIWNVLWESSPGSGCGYVAFVMASQESSGTVNLLAIYNWVIDNHANWFGCSSTTACEAGGSNPTELSAVEYGVEIAYTNGMQEFGVNNFSVTSN